MTVTELIVGGKIVPNLVKAYGVKKLRKMVNNTCRIKILERASDEVKNARTPALKRARESFLKNGITIHAGEDITVVVKKVKRGEFGIGKSE